MGDAAHAIVPFYGRNERGTEDVWCFAKPSEHGGDFEAAAFAEKRKPRRCDQI